MSTDTTASVSTHILDTSVGRPAASVSVELSTRTSPHGAWTVHGTSATDADGRCEDLPPLPEGVAHVRLHFDVGSYFATQADGPGSPTSPTSVPGAASAAARTAAEAQQDAPRARDSGAFFPEVAVAFAVTPGEHYHVPLLLNPFGYFVYRGS
ncbi:hydroxyisourate hydrolase [Streptomyces zagrosensis]|uniref:5-hydroxyisourate hydrolase n=1 Tax=Streptomyces zagrosensis TaxID=1042984 RepID=A0A7W9QA53_9ACTN|nr:hydroxyisourate hydrolase [Streptomyces zagrosensis]MBB5936204.1 5-hydroxyisourate hydrolase [Streptomyces zagrosensis]